MPPNALQSDIAAKLRVLSRDEQRQFLSLHNNFPGKHSFNGIVKTNALPCGSGSAVGGIYPTICLINHSCFPNSHNNWNSSAEHETIHAVQSIKAGEEITISYDHGGPLRVRQAHLKESFGFQCQCKVCLLTSSELQASNARRLQIVRLDKTIGNPSQTSNDPKRTLAACHSLLHVLREEFEGCAEPLQARLFYDAFQISIAHGDQARASVFAKRAYMARAICEGEDSPETQRMESLSVRPSGHMSYGIYSMKWKTEIENMPKSLNAQQYEKWLFRE